MAASGCLGGPVPMDTYGWQPKAAPSSPLETLFGLNFPLYVVLVHCSSHLDRQSKYSGSAHPAEVAICIRTTASGTGALGGWG